MTKDHPTMFYTMHDQCNISHDDLENMMIVAICRKPHRIFDYKLSYKSTFSDRSPPEYVSKMTSLNWIQSNLGSLILQLKEVTSLLLLNTYL